MIGYIIAAMGCAVIVWSLARGAVPTAWPVEEIRRDEKPNAYRLFLAIYAAAVVAGLVYGFLN